MNREQRDRERRLRERQASILGIDQGELERNLAAQERYRAKTGRAGFAPVDEPIQALAARLGVKPRADERCMRCGREVPERNELGGQGLRSDPGGELGLLCNGFFDETGQRIDCYAWREQQRSEQFARELRQARRERAAKAEAARPARRKGQLALPGASDDTEPPF